MFGLFHSRKKPASIRMDIAPVVVPVETGVVGFGYYTSTILDGLQEAGQSVKFLVDDREGASGDPFGIAHAAAERRIPILETRAFVDRVKSGATLYAGRLECGASTPLAEDPFLQVQDWVRKVTGQKLSLLHPVSKLASLAPRSCPNRYAVFGFPGSGNILTQNLIAGMYETRTEKPSADWLHRANLYEHYFYSTAARIRSLLAPLSPSHVDFIPHEFNTMMITVELGTERGGVAFYVPSQRHLGLQTFPTHSRPTREAIDFFASVQAPCVAVVRHPLETLLSQANKIARPSSVMLDHPRFLDRAAEQLADWTAHLLANRKQVHVVRYEDMAGRSVAELLGIAKWMGLSVSEAEAEALFDRFLNRNLPSAVPTHFFRGGNDKWRGEFSPRHLQRALAKIPPEVFTAFGYPVPSEADLEPVPFTGKPVATNVMHCAMLESFPFHPVPGNMGIEVTASDEALAGEFLKIFQNRELLELLEAGGLTARQLHRLPNEKAAA